MPRACSVCTHEERPAIEQQLAAGVALRDIEGTYAVSKSALDRHRGEHMNGASPDAAPAPATEPSELESARAVVAEREAVVAVIDAEIADLARRMEAPAGTIAARETELAELQQERRRLIEEHADSGEEASDRLAPSRRRLLEAQAEMHEAQEIHSVLSDRLNAAQERRNAAQAELEAAEVLAILAELRAEIPALNALGEEYAAAMTAFWRKVEAARHRVPYHLVNWENIYNWELSAAPLRWDYRTFTFTLPAIDPAAFR